MTTTSQELQVALSNVPNFLGCFPSDKLPVPTTNDYSFIINYDPSEKKGSHWVAIKCQHKNMCYFDSMGMGPDDDDRILGDKTHILQWMLREKKDRRIIINRIQYQSLFANTCGEWSALFIKSPKLLTRAHMSNNPDKFVQEWFQNTLRSQT